MKGFRGTWLLMVLVAALAGYTFWEYRNASREMALEDGERAAFSLKREDIDEVSLTSGGVTSVFKKSGDDWRMVKPTEDMAESSAVEGFLLQALTIRLKNFREDKDKVADWAKYGLDKPRAALALSGKGKIETVSLSTKNAFDGSFFVRLGDELYLGEAGLASIAERQPSSLRSRRLWRHDNASVTQAAVELNGGSSKYTLSKDGEAWSMQPSPKFKLDAAKIESWIESVQDLLPADVTKETLEEADKTEFLLKKPSLLVTLKGKDKDGKDIDWIVTIGQDRGEEIFLYTNQRPTIYRMNRSGPTKLTVPPEYFRDGHEPFQVPVEQARKVTLRTEKVFRTFSKTDKDWALSDADKDLELDQEKLVQLFQNLHTLEAVEILDKASGVKSPPQIEVAGEGGKPLFTLAWGDDVKPKQPWNAGQSLRAVEVVSRGAKTRVAVAKDKLDKLVDSGLVRKKKTEAPAPDTASKKASEKK